MIFSRKGDERAKTAEELKALNDKNAGLLIENDELRQDKRDLGEELLVAESFSGAFAELFRQFNDYLSTVAYISLTDEAKAIWYPVFENALTQLMGQASASDLSHIIDTSTFGELLEYMAESNPTIQATVAMLADEVFQRARRDAEEKVTRLHIVKAEGDAALQAPALVESMYAEYARSPEGKSVYDEAFHRKLGELAISDPEELAERLQHQAYTDATKAHLDREAERMSRELVIETAREDFFRQGINLSQLPVGTEVTIWLGTDKEFNDLHRESADDTDRIMVYYRKLRAFRVNDHYEGFDIYEDVIDPYPAWDFDEPDSEELAASLWELFARDTINESGRKKKEKKEAVSFDDTTRLDGRHLLGLSKKGYTDGGRRLERFIVAGKPLAYDGDPRNPEHKSTTLIVLNVAINGEPVVDFKQDSVYSRRDELKQAKPPRSFFGRGR